MKLGKAAKLCKGKRAVIPLMCKEKRCGEEGNIMARRMARRICKYGHVKGKKKCRKHPKRR